MTGTLEVRLQRSDDRDAVRRMVAAAFGDEGPRVLRLVAALHETGHARLSLVAVDDGEVVGHVLLSRCWVDARARLVEALVLSPLSAAVARQRSGIGATLLGEALESARRLEVPAVFLEGSPAYYGARGFARATELGFLRPSLRIPEPAFQVAVLHESAADLPGTVVYCDPFWELDCVGLRDPLLAEVEARLR